MEAVRTSTNTNTVTPAAIHSGNDSKKETASLSLFIQPKLAIGSPDDPLEKEADDMADKVMRMEMPGQINFSSAKNTVNRKCAHCEEEELKRKESSNDSVSVAPPIVHNVINSSGGRSLDAATRSFMEPRFNYDFSSVKIHDSDIAAKSASSINALAYTSGNNVVFNSGQYNTNSDSGKRLLAHELTHVVQQYGMPSGGSIIPSIQLEPKKDNDVGTTPLPTQEGEPVKADAATPNDIPAIGGTAQPTAVTQNTTPVTLTALYEDVPGESKDKDKRATGNAALWFDPLTIHSNYPAVKKNIRSVGVVSGGEQTIDTLEVPVTEDEQHVGQGSISAELKYAGSRSKSFNISVTGLKKKDAGNAETFARKVVEREMNLFGDVDEIAAIATKETKEVYPAAEISISVKNDKVMDAGQSSFFYKVHNPAGILMNVLIAPVGQKNTEYIGTKTTEKGTQDETAKKDKTTTETLDVTYNEKVVRTLDDYVTKMTEVHSTVASDLSSKVIEEKEAHYDDHEVTSRNAKNISDYTRELTQKTESGERDKDNLASKLQKIVKGAKKITSIPFLEKLPIIGKVIRKVKSWSMGLDLLDWATGLFAETGTVTFTDTKLEDEAKRTDTITDTTDRKRDVDLTETDKVELKRKLTEDYLTKTKDEWQRHLKDVKDISKTYQSKYKKNETETETKHGEQENQSTTATFKVSNTWKFTKPVIQATVVAGDAEVKNMPFKPSKSGEKNPTTAPGK